MQSSNGDDDIQPPWRQNLKQKMNDNLQIYGCVIFNMPQKIFPIIAKSLWIVIPDGKEGIILDGISRWDEIEKWHFHKNRRVSLPHPVFCFFWTPSVIPKQFSCNTRRQSNTTVVIYSLFKRNSLKSKNIFQDLFAKVDFSVVLFSWCMAYFKN